MRKYFLIEFEGEEQDFSARMSFSEALEKSDAGIIEMNRAEPINVEYIRASDIESLMLDMSCQVVL